MTTTDIGSAKALTATQVSLIAKHAKHANLNRQLTPEVLKDLDPIGINLIKIRLPFHHRGIRNDPQHHRVDFLLKMTGTMEPLTGFLDILDSDWEPLPTVEQMAAIVEAVARP
jgi:hypothetical protein